MSSQERADHNFLTDREANALLFKERIRRGTNENGPDQCGSRILMRRKTMTRLTAPQST
jgi:hypothetical protein